MYAILQLLHYLSNLSKNVATEALKKTEKNLFNGFLLWFLCASVAKKINPANRLRHTIHFKSVPNILMLSLFQPFINTKLRELHLQSQQCPRLTISSPTYPSPPTFLSSASLSFWVQLGFYCRHWLTQGLHWVTSGIPWVTLWRRYLAYSVHYSCNCRFY